MHFPGGASGKDPACQCRRPKRCRLDSWVEKIPWRAARQPIPVFLPGESSGQRSLTGYTPCGCKEVGHDWSDWAAAAYLGIHSCVWEVIGRRGRKGGTPEPSHRGKTVIVWKQKITKTSEKGPLLQAWAGTCGCWPVSPDCWCRWRHSTRSSFPPASPLSKGG